MVLWVFLLVGLFWVLIWAVSKWGMVATWVAVFTLCLVVWIALARYLSPHIVEFRVWVSAVYLAVSVVGAFLGLCFITSRYG